MEDVKLIDQFVGVLLGAMTGDALGRSFKNHSPEELMERKHEVGDEMIGGFYTEDTEMLITLAESLVRLGSVDPDDLADRFGEQLSPMRGYNPGELQVLYNLQRGMDWRDANTTVFEEGSYGVGGSCRAAPIGLLYHHDIPALIEAASASAIVTHVHPIGQAGAVTVALAVAAALHHLTPRGMYDFVYDALFASEFADFTAFLEPIPALLEDWPNSITIVEELGHRLTVQQCVPTALYSVLRYLRHPNSFEKTLKFAVSLGGDSDTIAAMAGAISGAYHGARLIPQRWLAPLENEQRGRDYALALATRLYDTWQTLTGHA